ncbi:MAG TPA: hypothetical protein DIC34_21625 [Treponema sp.]|nr:MAG: hypothetical protein A2001_17590 [Treponema sp. GWC1_61_84]OHE68487.1 MAG: hypothetical protein A2413_06735 [Treponema sp. RIFOXYC1_FULL_61_9]HCM29102.1 hypothetical protein [Treponema sp.]
MVLDLRTILFFQTLLGVLISVVMLLLRQGVSREMRGVGWWTIGFAAATVGQLLISLRGMIPYALTMVPANLLLAGSMTALFYGTRAFLGVKAPPAYGIAVLFAVAVNHTVFGHLYLVLTPRLALFALVGMVNSALCASDLYRFAERSIRRNALAVAAVQAVFFVIYALRLVGAFAFDVGSDWLSSTPWEGASLLAIALAQAALAFTMIELVDSRAQAQVAKGAEEKTLLIREMHHRTKNDFALVESLISLEAADKSDPDTGELLVRVRDRIHSFSVLHDQLYKGQATGKVNAGEYISLIATGLVESGSEGDRIVLRTSAESMVMEAGTAISIGLIVNELITNALKHAFPDGRMGTILLSLGIADGKGRLIVEDDGVGISADLKGRIGSGLGATLVSSLVGQIDGTMERAQTGTDGKGLRVAVDFPLPSKSLSDL